MRTKNFLVAALLALGFAACNNEDVPYFKEGAPATVSLMIFTDQTTVRSTTYSGTDPEREVNSLEVWLFAGETVVGHRYFTTNELMPDNGVIIAEGIVTTSGARTMVAVANHQPIGRNITRTGLRNTPALAKPSVYSNLTMTSVEVPLTLAAGANFFGEAAHLPGSSVHVNATGNTTNTPIGALQLVRIHARIALTGVSFEHPDFSRFDLYTVTMFNMREQSRLFDATTFSIATNTSLVRTAAPFVRGASYLSPLNSYQGTEIWQELSVNNTDNNNPIPIMAVNSAMPITTPIFFYALENYGDPRILGSDDWARDNTGTFIVLKGKLYDNNGNHFTLNGIHTCVLGYTYYAIWVNCYTFGGSSSIESNRIRRNTMYNIVVNIRGAGNPNVNSPQEAILDVQVQVRDWDVVNQVVNWGNPPTP